MRTLIACCCLFAAAASAQVYRGGLVSVRADGAIVPTGAVVRITELSQMAAQALAQSEAATQAAAASAFLSNEIARLEALIAARQQHAIFRGFVTSFSSVVDPITNATAQIVQIATTKTATNVICDLGCWYSAAPTNAPNIEWREKLTSGDWAFATQISNSWPDTYEVVGTGGVWDAYAIAVAMPLSVTSAFLRCNGNIQYWSGDQTVLDITGALRINGKIGLTTNIVVGSMTNHYEGGGLTEP
ncbi:MAG: hypothetical protein PHR35_11925 [Kiritimatiellae bacterium]|nr:hypothetical protein [Kiritimatiellia bacterium]